MVEWARCAPHTLPPIAAPVSDGHSHRVIGIPRPSGRLLAALVHNMRTKSHSVHKMRTAVTSRRSTLGTLPAVGARLGGDLSCLARPRSFAESSAHRNDEDKEDASPSILIVTMCKVRAPFVSEVGPSFSITLRTVMCCMRHCRTIAQNRGVSISWTSPKAPGAAGVVSKGQ